MSDEFGPVFFGDFEIRAEIEQGPMTGNALNALGLQQENAGAFFSIFPGVGVCTDKHDGQ